VTLMNKIIGIDRMGTNGGFSSPDRNGNRVSSVANTPKSVRDVKIIAQNIESQVEKLTADMKDLLSRKKEGPKISRSNRKAVKRFLSGIIKNDLEIVGLINMMLVIRKVYYYTREELVLKQEGVFDQEIIQSRVDEIYSADKVKKAILRSALKKPDAFKDCLKTLLEELSSGNGGGESQWMTFKELFSNDGDGTWFGKKTWPIWGLSGVCLVVGFGVGFVFGR